jgi:hypothetical protein
MVSLPPSGLAATEVNLIDKAILITLMDAIHMQMTGPVVRSWRSTLAVLDVDHHASHRDSSLPRVQTRTSVETRTHVQTHSILKRGLELDHVARLREHCAIF